MSESADDTPADLADLSALAATVENHLLGGPAEYTRADIAKRSGVAPDDLRALWRSLGLAVVEENQACFTDADLDAVRGVHELRAVGEIDDDVLRAMTRIIGQTFARLASWQGQLMTDIVVERPDLLADDGAGVLELIDELTPLVAGLHDYVWRRQLAAYFQRVAANTGAATDVAHPQGVGFADLAAFTAFTRRSSESELRAVLGGFETLAADIVGGHGGQIVKTIGDEVLFTAATPTAIADIALDLVAAAEDDDTLPSLRSGIAYGPVVARLGDVFGQTVNIASRLTSIARPGSVLVDLGESEALRSDDRFTLSSLRPVSVRGYHHLRSWRLRRASP